MKAWMRAKKARMAQTAKTAKLAEIKYRRIAITSTEQVRMLRELGWRDTYLSDLHEVATDDIRTQLAWFVYPNGKKWINVLSV